MMRAGKRGRRERKISRGMRRHTGADGRGEVEGGERSAEGCHDIHEERDAITYKGKRRRRGRKERKISRGMRGHIEAEAEG